VETYDEESDELDSEGDNELNLLTRKFKWNLKNLGYDKSMWFKAKDKEKVMYYECKKLGHYR